MILVTEMKISSIENRVKFINIFRLHVIIKLKMCEVVLRVGVKISGILVKMVFYGKRLSSG